MAPSPLPFLCTLLAAAAAAAATSGTRVARAEDGQSRPRPVRLNEEKIDADSYARRYSAFQAHDASSGAGGWKEHRKALSVVVVGAEEAPNSRAGVSQGGFSGAPSDATTPTPATNGTSEESPANGTTSEADTSSNGTVTPWTNASSTVAVPYSSSSSPGRCTGRWCYWDSDPRLAFRRTFTYLGGPVVHRPMNVYVVFYGNWGAHRCAAGVIRDLLSSIDPPAKSSRRPGTISAWWRTVANYYSLGADGRRGPSVTSKVTLKRIVKQPRYAVGVHGRNLTTRELYNQVVLGLVRSRLLPYDRSGVYLVLASPDVRLVSASGAPSSGCGTHVDLGPSMPLRMVYARSPVHDPGCIFSPDAGSQVTGLPPTANRCPSADLMASIVLHELAEVATDPLSGASNQPAWICSNTQFNCENGDNCDLSLINLPPAGPRSWPAGSPEAIAFAPARVDSSTGAHFNVEGVHKRRFYIQPMQNVVTKMCVMWS